jgi:hypothetical protein
VNTERVRKEEGKVNCYPCNRLWSPVRMWDVDDTLSGQSVHR